METRWLKNALFCGMTGEAFRLGIALTGGWFWMRIKGCTVLYCGTGQDNMDFENSLTVAEIDSQTISLPEYLSVENNSSFVYAVRRANGCGQLEYTLSAAVQVTIDNNGNMVAGRVSRIFAIAAKQIADSKAELSWYYCPLEQKQAPVCFKIYYDNRTGQLDYENPIATVSYSGRKFYRYQTDTLDCGQYLFAIRAEDADGVDDSSLACVKIRGTETRCRA